MSVLEILKFSISITPSDGQKLEKLRSELRLAELRARVRRCGDRRCGSRRIADRGRLGEA